jgi:hypothetical protein
VDPDVVSKGGHTLIEIAEEAELFHSPDRSAYATIGVDGHRETWPLASAGFKEWLSGRFYKAVGRAPRADAMGDALLTIAGRARYDGPEIEVHLRIAPAGERIVVDLGTSDWSSVVVGPGGWEITTAAPVRFRRTGGLAPLPRPDRGGSVDLLRDFINVANDDAWRLIVGWLVFAFSPTGPYPILLLHGEQGSAKSTAERMLRSLIDPNRSPLRATPKDQDDLMVATVNGWVIALDNLSSVQPWLSDSLCRIATGGGLAKRQLYTDQDETILQACRPIVLNGITDLATRGDLLDRSLLVDLEPIRDAQRQTERELWDGFEDYRPAIFGALLDAVAGALARLPGLERPRQLPRMADFAMFVTAAEEALGWSPGQFLATYEANRSSGNEVALEASPIVGPLRALLDTYGSWTGTASALRDALSNRAPDDVVRSRFWPANAWALGNTLNRLAPNLRAVGIDIERTRSSDGARERLLTLRRVSTSPGPDAADASDAAAGGSVVAAPEQETLL